MRVYQVHYEGEFSKNITKNGLHGLLKKCGLTDLQIDQAGWVGGVPRSFCNAKLDLIWVKRVL